MSPHFEFEISLRKQGIFPVAGVDEVGRGCLAGPVVAVAAILPINGSFDGVNDSKALSTQMREKWYHQFLMDKSLFFGIGIASSQEIDQQNIVQATYLAMKRSIEDLKSQNIFPQHLLVDGCFPIKNLSIDQTAIIRGDKISYSISAASIIAKVTRDRMMHDLHQKFPYYGFYQHKGYPTKQHIKQLFQYGICSEHRHSFSPVEKAIKRES